MPPLLSYHYYSPFPAFLTLTLSPLTLTLMGFTCTLTLKLSKSSFYCVGESEGGEGGERVRVRRVRRVGKWQG